MNNKTNTRRKLPATLMIQGTASDAGKSFTVAALCRWFVNQGYSVAPFKPQNMALNSAVTDDGGEIGRAQALQAQACRLAPSVHMNPVLLKPSSDTGAQVIIQGRAITAMEAQRFHDYKKVAMEAVLESHKILTSKYELVIVEGAGSPAEINLREGDIANMGFAEAVDCPVILVADIDKGGVFAQIVGTLALLSETERARVVGFIINRFRGDISLLKPGLEWLEEHTGKPVLGVIPYLQQCYLDSEDAIDRKQVETKNTENEKLNVVVPVYPRTSNHTDFDALRLHPNVNLQFIAPGLAPPPCDLIILPGSKNVRGDLAWLRDNNWPEYINKHLRYGGKLIGICGGYQMLGLDIDDPLGIEDSAGHSEGLGFIPMRTRLTEKKLTVNKSGVLRLGQEKAQVEGYEIHCGVSTFDRASDVGHSIIEYRDEASKHLDREGFLSGDQRILGTYLHGIFDNKPALSLLLRWAGLSSDLTSSLGEDYLSIDENRECQLQRIARVFEEHINLDRLLASIFDLKGP